MKFLEIPNLGYLASSLSHSSPECTVSCRIEAYSCKNIRRDKKLFKSLESTYTLDHEMTPFGPFDKHSSRKTLYLLIATLNVAFPDYEFSEVRPSEFSREESAAPILSSISTTLHNPKSYSSYPGSSPDLFPNSLPTSSSPSSPRMPLTLGGEMVSGTHPAVFRTIDNAIGLNECEVYTYSPPVEADPHGSDFSDEEDEYCSSESSDSELFEFDEYDEERPVAETVTSSSSPTSSTKTEHGTLLWSSTWFLLNRKLKRILFISIWARSKRERFTGGERFIGWEGAIGAGARALGL